MANKLQVFTRTHFKALKDAQRDLHDILPEIDKADRCGIECREFREVLDELSRRFTAIEREFMTPPPK